MKNFILYFLPFSLSLFHKHAIMEVSVIIVNYKTTGLIVNCISSIRNFTKNISYEIIVVDNDSKDNCRETLMHVFPDENIVFLSLDSNEGFGRANNHGFKVAKGRNILCLNPDTVIINNAIKVMSDYLDKHYDVGACGGNLFDENMLPAHSFCRLLPSVEMELHTLTFRKFEKLVYCGNTDFNHTGHPLPVGYITGADLMLKREVLDKVGCFDPSFFMYYEETDLCFRIAHNGYKIISLPDAKIQHLEGRSFSPQSVIVNEQRLRMKEESRMIYYRKNVGKVETRVANIIYLAALQLNKLIFRCLRREIWKCYDCRMRIFQELMRKA